MRHVEDCGAEARVVLERLLWSPTGAVRYADRPVSLVLGSVADRAPAQSPVAPTAGFGDRDHASRGVMAAPGWTLHRRAGRHRAAGADRPAIVIRDLVDRAAAGAAFALLHDIELLAHQSGSRAAQTAPRWWVAEPRR